MGMLLVFIEQKILERKISKLEMDTTPASVLSTYYLSFHRKYCTEYNESWIFKKHWEKFEIYFYTSASTCVCGVHLLVPQFVRSIIQHFVKDQPKMIRMGNRYLVVCQLCLNLIKLAKMNRIRKANWLTITNNYFLFLCFHIPCSAFFFIFLIPYFTFTLDISNMFKLCISDSQIPDSTRKLAGVRGWKSWWLGSNVSLAYASSKLCEFICFSISLFPYV